MFKVGDKVRLLRSGFTYSKGDVFTVVEGTEIEDTSFWIHNVHLPLCINDWGYSDLFELVQEEQSTKRLKQNWSIRVHSKEQAEVYEKTLIALGYALTRSSPCNQWSSGVKCLYNSTSENCFWYSHHPESRYDALTTSNPS